MSTSINRFNMYQLSPYERMQWQRQQRADALAQQEKMASMASSFAAIQTDLASSQGDLFSKIAMTRMSKTA